jgi:predicted HTH transcriptional regulator
MANTTITRKSVLNKVLDNSSFLSTEEIEIVKKMISSLDRKSSSSKLSKTVIENFSVKNDILALIADGRARTAKEIADALDISVNRVASLVSAMVKDSKVEKIKGEKSKDAPKYVAFEGATPYEIPVEEKAAENK